MAELNFKYVIVNYKDNDVYIAKAIFPALNVSIKDNINDHLSSVFSTQIVCDKTEWLNIKEVGLYFDGTGFVYILAVLVPKQMKLLYCSWEKIDVEKLTELEIKGLLSLK